VRIPIEPAPADPSWVIKKHARRKFNPLEAEEYYKNEFEEECRRLINDVQNATNDAMKVDKRRSQNLNHINQWLNVPSEAAMSKVVAQYNSKKRNFMKCMDG